LCVYAVYLATPYCESNGSYLSISVMPFTDFGQYQNPSSLHLYIEHGGNLKKCCWTLLWSRQYSCFLLGRSRVQTNK